MSSAHLGIGMLACAAKLMTLPSVACTIEHPMTAAQPHYRVKQLYGRGMWDHVPQASEARFAMGAASEVATVRD